MPAAVVFAVSPNAHAPAARFQLLDEIQRLQHFLFLTDDAD